MIDNEGDIKLVDFGYSKMMEKDKTFTLCGTQNYMCPELIKGEENGYGFEIDWWALGVLLYQMATKKLPFEGPDPFEVLKSILQAKIDYSSIQNNILAKLIKMLLQVDISKRYTDSKKIMNHSWFNTINWSLFKFQGLY